MNASSFLLVRVLVTLIGAINHTPLLDHVGVRQVDASLSFVDLDVAAFSLDGFHLAPGLGGQLEGDGFVHLLVGQGLPCQTIPVVPSDLFTVSCKENVCGKVMSYIIICSFAMVSYAMREDNCFPGAANVCACATS